MSGTPGPWYWEQTRYRGKQKGWRLYTPKNGHCIVMDFARSGMQGAQPRFSGRGDAPLGGIMINADEMENIYDNPDARLLSRAPDLLETLRTLLYVIKAGDLFQGGCVDRAEALISELDGELK